jgi:glycine dehydrogenase
MAFIWRHLGNNSKNITKMLSRLNYNSVDSLVNKVIPPNIKIKYPYSFPPISEKKVLSDMKKTFAGNIGNKLDVNKPTKFLVGMDFHESTLPTVISRNLLENPKWYTAYTPYQAEISQGRMESLFNFQTLVCELTDLPISNCSLLDSASASAEAFNIAHNVHKGKRSNFFCDNMVHPVLKSVLETRANLIGANIVYADINEYEFKNGNNEFSGVLFSYPNVRGDVKYSQDKINEIKSTGAIVATHNDILSLMMLKPPGQIGVDISFGTTQRFGLPFWNGGPHSAFFATTAKLLRFVPGRIVGLSRCRNGNDSYRLALQTREQHIKKERALSNICTSQALLANTSAMWAIYYGKEELMNKAIRVNVLRNVFHKILSDLKSRIEVFGDNNINFDQVSFTTNSKINKQLQFSLNKGGYSTFLTNYDNILNENINIFNEGICISLGETVTIDDVYDMYSIIASVTGNNYLELVDRKRVIELYDTELKSITNMLSSQLDNTDYTDDTFLRMNNNTTTNKPFLYQDIFKHPKSETWMVRYMNKLADKDYSLVTGMIPLGSCTMKLNATTEMIPLSWNELQNLHPFCQMSREHRDSYNVMIDELSERLKNITGFDYINYQSNSGAMGELSGLAVIKSYHKDISDGERNTILIPESAHGTNFSSARLAGFKIKRFSDSLSASEFKDVCESLGNKLAGLMITYPTTYGLFNSDIKEVCEIIHTCGGLVYMDGANMNAQCGLTSPRECGADICHLNLHKTFCIPHGGGGPGMGPIGVTNELKKYLPINPLVKSENCGDEDKSYGALTMSPCSSASILSIPLIYLKLVGSEGVKMISEQAILNANYLKDKLSKYYTIFALDGVDSKRTLAGHEFIITLDEFSKLNISDKDIAKRLIDYNFHPPTMAWPVPKSLMIEPTESEGINELDRFIDAMIKIREEIEEVKSGKYPIDNNPLVNAPHSLDDISNWDFPYPIEKAFYPIESLHEDKLFPTRSRVDDIYGDRNLVVSRTK